MKFAEEQTRKKCEQAIDEIESILEQYPDEEVLASIIDDEFVTASTYCASRRPLINRARLFI